MGVGCSFPVEQYRDQLLEPRRTRTVGIRQ